MLFFNFICLFYLMVLINCHTISKSIADDEQFNEIIDSFNDFDYTTEHKLKHDRFHHKYRRGESKDTAKKTHKTKTEHKKNKNLEKYTTQKHATTANVTPELLTTVEKPSKVILSLWRKLHLFSHKAKTTTKEANAELKKDSFFQNESDNQQSDALGEDVTRKRKGLRRARKSHVKKRRGYPFDSSTKFEKKLVTFSDHDIFIRPFKQFKTYQPMIDNYTTYDNKYMRNFETPTYNWDKSIPVVYNFTPYTNEDNFKPLELDPSKNTGPILDKDTEYGTAALETLINEIKVHAIKMIAEQNPSVSDIITNAVTETTYEVETSLANNAKPGMKMVTMSPMRGTSKVTEVIRVNLVPTSHPVTETSKGHNVNERSVKNKIHTVGYNFEDKIQKEVKCAYEKAKHKIQQQVNQVKSTTKKFVNKTAETLKGIAKGFMPKCKCTCPKPCTCHPPSCKKPKKPPEKKPCGKNLERLNPMEPMSKIPGTIKTHQLGTHKGKRHNINIAGSSTESYNSLPALEDDYSMLKLFEQVLAKSHEDNVMKMLTTQAVVSKRKTLKERLKLSKRNLETVENLALKENIRKMADGEGIPGEDFGLYDDRLYNSTYMDKESLATLGIATEDSSYEGLTNKISYNEFVNGYKHYLNFAKELDNEKFSDTIRYQAHRHHSVDDIGKFILNKLPPVPDFMKRSKRHFFDDTDTEDQDISTKSDDSWFKKHFYIFVDNSPQKKFHTSQTVSVKYPQHEESPYTRVVKSKDMATSEDDDHFISFEPTTPNSMSSDYEDTTKDPESELDTAINDLESKKQDNNINEILDTTTISIEETMKEVSAKAEELENKKELNPYILKSPQYLINKLLGRTGTKKPKPQDTTEAPVKKERPRRNNRKDVLEIPYAKDFEHRKSNLGINMLDQVPLNSAPSPKYKNYGYVDVNMVEKSTKARSKKKKKKKSRLKSLFNKITFHKDKRPRREARKKKNPFKKIKEMFKKLKNVNYDTDYNMMATGPELDNLKYNNLPDLTELFREVPNITMDENYLVLDKIIPISKVTARRFDDWTSMNIKNIPSVAIKATDSVFTTPFDNLKFKFKIKPNKEEKKTTCKYAAKHHSTRPITSPDKLPITGTHVTITPITMDELLKLVESKTNASASTFSPMVATIEKVTPNYDTTTQTKYDFTTLMDKFTFYPRKEVLTLPNVSKIKFMPQQVDYSEIVTKSTRTPFRKGNSFIAVITRAELRKDRHSALAKEDVDNKNKAQSSVQEQRTQKEKRPKGKAKKYHTVPDYFDDLMNWHQDVLNMDTVKGTTWDDAYKTISDQITTPNVENLKKEVLVMTKYLQNLEKVSKSAPGKKENVTRNKVALKKSEINTKSTGERRHKAVDKEFEDLLRQGYDAKFKSLAGTKNPLPETDDPNQLSVDTTILSYDDTVSSVTENMKKKTTTVRPKSKGTSPIAKINTPPKQYFTTPMPMQNNDFDKFLKEHDLDIPSITSPFSGISKFEGDFMKKVHLKPKLMAGEEALKFAYRRYEVTDSTSLKTTYEEDDNVFQDYKPGKSSLDDDEEFINQLESSLIGDEIEERDKRDETSDASLNTLLKGVFTSRPLRSHRNASGDSIIPDNIDITIIDFDDTDSTKSGNEETTEMVRTNKNQKVIDSESVERKLMGKLKKTHDKQKLSSAPHHNLWFLPKGLTEKNDLNNISQIIFKDSKFSDSLLKPDQANSTFLPAEITESQLEPSQNFQITNKVKYGDIAPKRVQISHTYKYDVQFNDKETTKIMDSLWKTTLTRRSFMHRQPKGKTHSLTSDDAEKYLTTTEETSSRRAARKAIWRNFKSADLENTVTDPTTTTKKRFKLPNIFKPLLDKLRSFSGRHHKKPKTEQFPDDLASTGLLNKTDAIADLTIDSSTLMKLLDVTPPEKKREGRETKSKATGGPQKETQSNATTTSKPLKLLKTEKSNVTSTLKHITPFTAKPLTVKLKRKTNGEDLYFDDFKDLTTLATTDEGALAVILHNDIVNDLKVEPTENPSTYSKETGVLWGDAVTEEPEVKMNSPIPNGKQLTTEIHSMEKKPDEPLIYENNHEGWVIYQTDDEKAKANAVTDAKKIEVEVTIGDDSGSQTASKADSEPGVATKKNKQIFQEDEAESAKKTDIFKEDNGEKESGEKERTEEKAAKEEKVVKEEKAVKEEKVPENDKIKVDSEENSILETENEIKQKADSIVKAAKKKVMEQEEMMNMEKAKTIPQVEEDETKASDEVADKQGEEITKEREEHQKDELTKEKEDHPKDEFTKEKEEPIKENEASSNQNSDSEKQETDYDVEQKQSDSKENSEDQNTKPASKSKIYKVPEKEREEKLKLHGFFYPEKLNDKKYKETKTDKSESLYGKNKTGKSQSVHLQDKKISLEPKTTTKHQKLSAEEVQKLKNKVEKIISEKGKPNSKHAQDKIQQKDASLEFEIKKIKDKIDSIINPIKESKAKVSNNIKMDSTKEKNVVPSGVLHDKMKTVPNSPKTKKALSEIRKSTKPALKEATTTKISGMATVVKSPTPSKPASLSEAKKTTHTTHKTTEDVTTMSVCSGTAYKDMATEDDAFPKHENAMKTETQAPKLDKREIQDANRLYTAKSVAALEIIVDLMKETQDRMETTPNSIWTKTPVDAMSKLYTNTNSIQVHIAIPYNVNDKKRSAEPLKLRKVFSAKMSAPVDLEYQIRSYDISDANDRTSTDRNMISPGMYVLVERPSDSKKLSNFALKPIKPRDLANENFGASTIKTSTKDFARVTLTKDFVQSVNDQLWKLYQNLSTIDDATESIRKRRDEDFESAKKTERRIKKRLDWHIFNGDRTCSCKCEENKTMCRACAASDAVMSELLFEFDNLAKYMNDHCTEIQTYFWMNPTGGRKLRDLIRRIDKNLSDYYKRVKGKCQGRTCNTFQTYIDKRDNTIPEIYDKIYIGNPLIHDLDDLSNDLGRAASLRLCSPNDMIGKKVDDLLRVTRSCLKENAVKKTGTTKNIYSLDNINVNIICSQEKPMLMNYSASNFTAPPVVLNTEPSVNSSYFTYEDDEINNQIKGMGLKRFFKRKSRTKNQYKREIIKGKSLNDFSGTFWRNISAINSKSNKEAVEPLIRLRVLERNENFLTLRPDLKATLVQITPEKLKKGKNAKVLFSGYKTDKRKHKKPRQDSRTVTKPSATRPELLSYNMNELIKVFESLPDVQEIKNLAETTLPTTTITRPKSKIRDRTKTTENLKATSTKTKQIPTRISKTTRRRTTSRTSATHEIITNNDLEAPTASGQRAMAPTKKSWIEKLKIMITGKGDDDEAPPEPHFQTKPIISTTHSTTSSKDARESRSATQSAIDVNSCATTVTYPTIFIIEEFADKPNEDLKNVDEKDHLLISIMQYEQGKLNNEMRRFVEKHFTTESQNNNDLNDIFIVEQDRKSIMSPSLSSTTPNYDMEWLDSYTEPDPEVASPRPPKNAFGRLFENFIKKDKEFPKADDRPPTTKHARSPSQKIGGSRTGATSVLQTTDPNLHNSISSSEFYTAKNMTSTEPSVEITLKNTETTTELTTPTTTKTKSTTKTTSTSSETKFVPLPTNNDRTQEKAKLTIRITGSELPIVAKVYTKSNVYPPWTRITGPGNVYHIQKQHNTNSLLYRNRTTARYIATSKRRKISVTLTKLPKSEDERLTEVCDPRPAHRVCDVHATADHVVDLRRRLSREAFELYVRNLTCFKYRKPPDYFLVEPFKKHVRNRRRYSMPSTPGLRWNWIRKRRSLLTFKDDGDEAGSLKIEEPVGATEAVCRLNTQYDFDNEDYFERLYIDEDNVYRKRKKRRKRTAGDLQKLALGLGNLPRLSRAKDEVYVMVGDKLMMRCHRGDQPVEWQTDREEMLALDNVAIREGVVRVRNVSAKNSGNYTCSVNNKPLRMIKLTVVQVPQYRVIFIPMYYSESGCTYDDLHDLQWLGPVMSREGCGFRHDAVKVEEPICLQDKDDSTTHLRATAVLTACPQPVVKCSVGCRRDLQASMALLCASNVPALSGVKVVLSRNGGKWNLLPSTRSYSQMIVTHTLRKRDLRGHREFHQLASSMSPGNVDVVVVCPAGFFLISHLKICAACPADTYSEEGGNTCYACPLGTSAPPGAPRCRLSLRRIRRYEWWTDDWALELAVAGGVVCAGAACALCAVLRRRRGERAQGVSVARVVESRWTWSKDTAAKKCSSTIADGRGRPLSPSAVILTRFFRRWPSTSRVSESQETKFEQWKEKNIPPALPPIDFDLT